MLDKIPVERSRGLRLWAAYLINTSAQHPKTKKRNTTNHYNSQLHRAFNLKSFKIPTSCVFPDIK